MSLEEVNSLLHENCCYLIYGLKVMKNWGILNNIVPIQVINDFFLYFNKLMSTKNTKIVPIKNCVNKHVLYHFKVCFDMFNELN